MLILIHCPYVMEILGVVPNFLIRFKFSVVRLLATYTISSASNLVTDLKSSSIPSYDRRRHSICNPWTMTMAGEEI